MTYEYELSEEYAFDHTTEEQSQRWERDATIERQYKNLIEPRRLGLDPMPSRYPADISEAKKQKLDAELETIKAELVASNLYAAVLDKGIDFFWRNWTQYITITEELFLLAWLRYCVEDYGELMLASMKFDGYRHLLPLKPEHMMDNESLSLQPEVRKWLNAQCRRRFAAVRPIPYNQAYIGFNTKSQ